MTPQVALPQFPEPAVEAFEAAKDSPDSLRDVAAANPTFSAAWGELARHAYDGGDTIAAYAFARTGYHRGLDAMRAGGWNGSQTLDWEHSGNRGMLVCLFQLMRAAAAIGEGVEARRCREFLLQLDPQDHFGVASIKPRELSGRLPE